MSLAAWDDDKKTRSMTKLRLGDVGEKKKGMRKHCSACQEDNLRDMRAHMILECPAVAASRNAGRITGIKQCGRALGRSQTQILQEILGDTSRENIANLVDMHTKWEKAAQT